MRPERFALIGRPVGHSKSPLMHRAAFSALSLPHTYDALETTEAELPRRVDELRNGLVYGLNVTIPHKVSVMQLADEVDESARAVGAANTLVRTEGGLVRAYNTDAQALADELGLLLASRGLGGETFAGASAVVLGSGGAARAAVVALAAHLGIAEIIVRGRAFEDPERASAFVREMRGALDGRAIVAEPLAQPAREAPELLAIVQATSCGMRGAAPGDLVSSAVHWASVPKNAVAIDVVYAPTVTPFLERAATLDLARAHGLGMLARQGARAFELWLGVPAPFAAMLEAIS